MPSTSMTTQITPLTRRQACTVLGGILSAPLLGRLARAALRPPQADRAVLFLEAVRAGDTARVRALLAEDAALACAIDDRGRSAYVLAYLHGHEETAGVLLEIGWELDIVEAVLAEDWGRVEALAGADPTLINAVHPIGGAPIYAAALVGSNDMWRLRSLGADPDLAPAGGTGFTPARGAVTAAHGSWAHIALTDLCSNGGDVNARQPGGSSVLHGAVMRQDESLVRLAIRKGGDADAKDDAGRTPAVLAAEIGWKEGATLLADPRRLARDNRSSRFLLDANRQPIERPDLSDVSQRVQSEVTGNSHFNLKKVRELVAADPRLVYAISSDDELAIEACAHIGNRPIIRFHLDHGAPLSLPTAVSLGDTETVKFWLDRDPTLRDERGAHDFPVMWYAVLGGGSVEMAELLDGYGVPIDQESKGTTALHWCAKRRDYDLARWLVDRGADKDALGHNWVRAGQTALQIADAEGDSKMAAILKAT